MEENEKKVDKKTIKDKTLMGKLHYIQQKLKATKSLYNDFGKYKYRSLESILSALKPLMEETGTTIIIGDELVLIGERYYVKANVLLTHGAGTDKIESSAYAREAIAKKGMDESQITGACSSYARKYAMNGLLAIDDTKDADHGKNESEPTFITEEQFDTIDLLIKTAEPDMEKFLAFFGIKEVKELKVEDFDRAVTLLKKKVE